MKKSAKLLISGLVATTVCFGGVSFLSTEAQSSQEAKPKKSEEKNTQTDKKENNAKETEKKSTENGDTKTEIEESSDDDDSASDSKHSKSKAAIIFKDGSKISEGKVTNEVNSIPEQFSSKMSLAEAKALSMWKLAYKKVINKAAKKAGIDKKKGVARLIEKRKATAAGFILLDKKTNKLMTKEALKSHYDKLWDENFKNTKEFHLNAITTTDKAAAKKIKDKIKTEKDLDEFVNANKTTTKYMPMDGRPEGMFPPEISSAVLKQGANTIVGPFEVKGTHMLFFVKKIEDAKKQEFTSEFEKNYKKIAMKDFTKKYIEELYKKYKVNITDLNGKPVDPFKIIDKDFKKNDKKDKTKKTADLTKVEDSKVFATIGEEKITAKHIKDFFKVESLVDDTFISMAQQFEIQLEEVITYAVKLVIDDLILNKEVVNTKYDQKSYVKKKLNEIEEIELEHAYFKEVIKVSPEDIKKSFNKFLESIPEDEKNDNEIATKLLFFPTKEDASKVLKDISEGKEKFGNVFSKKTSSDAAAIDLKYITKQSVPPELWMTLKKGASGACCKDIIEIDGTVFGAPGKSFAIAYVSDRRPITLPDLKNPADKQAFQRLASREKAIELAKKELIANVETIDGKPIEEWSKKDAGYLNKILSMLIGFAG